MNRSRITKEIDFKQKYQLGSEWCGCGVAAVHS